MSEFLNKIIEMAQGGNWNGIAMLVIGSITAIVTSIGGIAGLVAIVNKLVGLVGNKKILNKFSDIVLKNTDPLKETLIQVKNQLEISVKETLERIKIEFKKEIINLKNEFGSFVAEQKAFSLTVLNNEELQLKFENYKKELLLAKDKAILLSNDTKEEAEVQLDNVETILTAINKDIKEVVTETEKSVKTKIKAKKKIRETEDVEYV